MRRLAIPLLLALSSCAGIVQTHEAADPFGKQTLVGHSIADLESCAGLPDKVQQTAPDWAVAQWGYTAQSTSLKVTILGEGLQVGGNGTCKMAATFLRDGTIVNVAFPGSHESGLAIPKSACSPIVSECMRGGIPDAGAPPGYDAFTYSIAPAAKPAIPSSPKG